MLLVISHLWAYELANAAQYINLAVRELLAGPLTGVAVRSLKSVASDAVHAETTTFSKVRAMCMDTKACRWSLAGELKTDRKVRATEFGEGLT
jgi:hypothetical protein